MERNDELIEDEPHARLMPNNQKCNNTPKTVKTPLDNLDLTTPLDFKLVLSVYGDKRLFFHLIPSFEKQCLFKHFQSIANCARDGDFLELYLGVHSLRGGSGYCGASKVYADCWWIEQCYNSFQYVNMMKHLLNLIEHSAEFCVYSRIVICTYEGSYCSPEMMEVDLPLPPGYSLTKVGEYEFKVNYPDDYLMPAEEAERRGKQYIRLPQGGVKIVYTKDGELQDDKNQIGNIEKKEESKSCNISREESKISPHERSSSEYVEENNDLNCNDIIVTSNETIDLSEYNYAQSLPDFKPSTSPFSRK